MVLSVKTKAGLLTQPLQNYYIVYKYHRNITIFYTSCQVFFV